jgi:hypothetical protein
MECCVEQEASGSWVKKGHERGREAGRKVSAYSNRGLPTESGWKLGPDRTAARNIPGDKFIQAAS